MNILRSGAASAVALLMLTVAPGPLMSGAAAQETTKVASGHSLAIQVNQGQLVRIDKPVESVFVANSEIADVAIKSPQLIYVYAKHPGTTTLYAVGANDEILASITLNVTHNLSRLDQAIADLMPGRNIAATSIEGGIVLTGMVSSPGEAEDARRLAARFIGANEEIINRLQVNAPNQVNVRVRIAEINKTVLRHLGINWDTAIQEGGFAFGLLTAFPVTVGSTLVGSTGPGTTPTVSAGPLDLTATMVNGPYQVYIERKGKLELTDVKFRDNQHVLNICSRIVSQVGRRVDESQPLCDARLLDGSRVNIIIPPLAIDGPSISIRKFSKKGITLDIMVHKDVTADLLAQAERAAPRRSASNEKNPSQAPTSSTFSPLRS